jgi:ABC-type branched-subunit amino acid transport system ATPase component
MRALSGLNRPVGGSVLFLGRRIERYSASRIVGEGLVLVPEGRQVFPELAVIDNIRLGAYARADADLEAMAEKLLDRFAQLKARRNQRAGLLSGGEQQMLAIARGLMARPAVLMLDEPSLGLAPMLIESLYDLLAELRDEGTTILLVDQMAALALSVADRAYVLQSGTIRQGGRAAQMRADPAIAQAYLGEQERAGPLFGSGAIRVASVGVSSSALLGEELAHLLSAFQPVFRTGEAFEDRQMAGERTWCLAIPIRLRPLQKLCIVLSGRTPTRTTR